jgi:GABA permease
VHIPLRSEAEVFRLVVIVGGAAAVVIAVTLLTRPAVGAVLAAAFIGVGVGLAWRNSRGAEPRSAEIADRPADATYRILVVANETVGGRALLEEIRNRAKGRDAEIRVVTPALTRSQLQHWASDVDEALAEAEVRRRDSVRAIETAGLRARCEVGDEDPNVAIEDALREFPADEIVISTHPPERSRWLERGVVEKARNEVDLPITHVVVDLAAESSVAARA